MKKQLRKLSMNLKIIFVLGISKNIFYKIYNKIYSSTTCDLTK